MKNLSTRLTALSTALIFGFGTVPAHSADWISEFYTSAGAAANVTQPQAIASQSVVGYSGGGLAWRIPNKTFQPLQITPPSLKAGCGGIDAYLGGFSFPNKDEFVQSLRNVGQASIGYFFQLALKSLAPEIGITLDVINDIAMKINSMGKNSCEMGKWVAGAAVDRLKPYLEHDASGYASAAGKFVDYFSSNEEMKANGGKTMQEKYEQNYAKPRGSLTSADIGTAEPLYGDLLYFAMKKAKIASFSQEEMELVISMIGVHGIYNGKDNEKKEVQKPNNQPALIGFKQLVGLDNKRFSTADQMEVYKCNDVECSNPTKTNFIFNGFSYYAEKAIEKTRRNVSGRTNSGYSSEEEMVMKLASVPLYRAAAMAETPSGIVAVVANSLIGDLADYAAVDAGIHFVLYYLGIADRSLQGAAGELAVHKEQLDAIREQIKNIRTNMYADVDKFYKEKGNPYEKIEILDKVEKAMYANMNVNLAANVRFGQRGF